MAWKSIVTHSSIGEGQKTPYVELEPNEEAHVFVERTDAGSSEQLFALVWGSIDASEDMEVPLQTYTMDPADKKMDFIVSGPLFSFAIGLSAVAGSDTQTAVVKTRLNGGLT